MLTFKRQIINGLVLSTGLLFPLSALSADSDSSSVKEIQSLMLNWTGLERQKDTLQSNWQQEQPVLEQQLLLLEKEQDELNSLLESTESSQDDVEQQRLLLLQEQTSMEGEQSELEQLINEVVIGIERIFPQLPPPMSDAWRTTLPRLSSEILTTSERLQLAVEMLTELDDFQQKITLHEATLNVDDGTPYLVRQVYLGLSHGWYISADGSQAASGSVTPEGWRWQPSNDGDVIKQFISILDSNQTAELISLPVTLVAPSI